jgi:hypothetical protein
LRTLFYLCFFVKVLLSTIIKIEGVFLFVKGYFGIEQQGLAMRLGKEGGEAAALIRNQLTFWSSHPARGHF